MTAFIFILGSVFAASNRGDVLWRYPAGPGASGPGGVQGTPCETYYGIDNAGAVISSGAIFFTSEHTGWRVFALEVATGAERWNLTTKDTKAATAPAVGGGAVVFAAVRENGARVTSVDAASGAVRWGVSGPGTGVHAPPVVGGGSVYISLDDGVHAYDAATGSFFWRGTNTGCSLTVPFVVSDSVFASGGRGVNGLVSLDAGTGSTRWSALPRVDNPWTSPIAAGGRVFTGGFVNSGPNSYYTGCVYAVNASTGLLLWMRNLTDVSRASGIMGGNYAPILARELYGGLLFVAGATSTLFALDAGTGEIAWNASTGCGHLWMVPAAGAGTVYAGCDNGKVFAFDASTGFRSWVASAPGSGAGFAARSPLVEDGKVYVGFNGYHDSSSLDELVVFAA